MRRPSELAVWMNGRHVGTWADRRRGGGSFRYDPGWVASPDSRVLSLSLPFTPGNVPHRGAAVESYFDNLLPDHESIRRRLRSRFGIASTTAFDLLTEVGRDCVGAVQLLRVDEEPRGYDRIEAVPLDEDGVERILTAATSDSPSLDENQKDDFRISLAGAQEKTALLHHEGRWCRPVGATPTTHILKLPLGLIGGLRDLRDSVENEWLCLHLLQEYGLAVARSSIETMGGQKVLVVERFDRDRKAEGWIARRPQEDFCQILGLPSTRKYESDGGPGMRDILGVLEGSVDAGRDRLAFVKAQILFWMLGAIDGHAKNYSIFLERQSRYRLTPFYDVLSAWPLTGKGPGRLDARKIKLALAVRGKNAHWKVSEITPRHWDGVTQMAGLGDARAILEEIAARTPGAIEAVNRALPAGFPDRVAGPLFEQLQRMAALVGDETA